MRRLAAILILTAMAFVANGQYYNDGQERFGIKWNRINTPRYSVIFPRGAERQGRQTAAILDTIAPHIGFGFSLPARKVPVLLHTGNLHSNGVVVWAPKRAELITTPPVSTYATPWLWQLTVHEYRHVVQMSNLYRGTLKAATYLFGQQAIALGAAQLSPWFLEGDAVLAETAFSSFGRGLQPEFTLEYRAYMQERDVRQFPADKWFAGSFRDYIPDHYALGYQLVNHARNRYGDDFQDKVTRYVARNPFLIAPKHFALKKYYDTSGRKLLHDAFDALKTKWDSLPRPENSARIIETPTTSHTLYSYPLYIDDTTVVALKSDFDRPLRFVEVNTRTGGEKHLRYVGQVVSRPIYARGELIWVEHRPSLFWEQHNGTVIRKMNLSTGEIKQVDSGNVLFISEYGDGFAAMEYDGMKSYGLVLFDKDFKNKSYTDLTNRDNISIHGLAWDGRRLWAIAMNETGMFQVEVDPSHNLFSLRPSAPSDAIAHLFAADGKLLYTSVASGRDEVHVMDVKKQQEYRLTTSQFGSKMASFSPGGEKSVQVTYTPRGYMLSEQALEFDSLKRLEYGRIPDNIFNMPVYMASQPPRVYQEFISLSHHEVKKYRKLPHALDLHSWAPASFDPLETGSDRNIELDMGATVMSQNTLGTTTGYVTYGQVEGENFLRGAVQYRGFAPEIEAGFEYGGGDTYIISDFETIFAPRPSPKPYFSAYGEVSLPFDLSSGAFDRHLTPVLRLTHVNALVHNSATRGYDKGYQMGEAAISYSQNMNMAYRALAPRWGWSGRVSVAGVPFSSLFGTIYSATAGVYLPGVARNHSLRLRGAVQYQDTDRYNLSGSALFPRGIQALFPAGKLGTALADYTLPLAYPDGGISGLIYIKRIYANLFGGYSRFEVVGGNYYNVHSYGADFHFNTNPLRLVNGSVDLRASIFRTSLDDGLKFSVGMSIDI